MIGSLVLLEGTRLDSAVALSDAASWNHTRNDWGRLARLEPEGCFGVELDGAIVATTTVVCYGQLLAWIGMVVTHPDHRGRGFARRLMTCALEYCERRDIAWIKLDATDLGHPLYTSLGFQDECVIERWTRPGSATSATAPSTRSDSATTASTQHADSFQLDRALDLEAFGADRHHLLRMLAEDGEAACRDDAFALARPGRRAFHFGPCVARDEQAARGLVSWYLASHPDAEVNWDVLETNPKARDLAQAHGFRPTRRLIRMVRPGQGTGITLRGRDDLVYAGAGFEYG